MIPLYLLHVTNVPHDDSPGVIIFLLCCNAFVVISGIVFIYKLFRVRNVLKPSIVFGTAILINYLAIAIYGDIFDLLG